MQIDPKWLQDPWVRSMLPESDRQANMLALGMGTLSFAFSFWFSTMKTKPLSVGVDINSKSVTQAANINKLVEQMKIEEPPKPPEPPKPKVEPDPNQKKTPDKEVVAEEKQASTEKVDNREGAAGTEAGGGGPKAGRGNSSKQSRGALATITAMTSKYGAAASNFSNALKDINSLVDKQVGFKKVGASSYEGRKGDPNASLFGGNNKGGKGDGWGGGDGSGWGGGSGKGIGNAAGGGGGGLTSGGTGGRNIKGSGGARPKVAGVGNLSMTDDGSGRTKQEILRVVRMRQGGLKYLLTKYNKNGEISSCQVTVTFVIAPAGDVVSANKAGSTCGNSGFEGEVLAKVKDWNFGPAPKAGNVTSTVALGFNAD